MGLQGHDPQLRPQGPDPCSDMELGPDVVETVAVVDTAATEEDMEVKVRGTR